ncbi:MAG: hypothetical protein QF464_01180 [Myxococcota bacterium]|jgi:hypothetical protein|nr:hypothetical protein [Myxococcota bacterium]
MRTIGTDVGPVLETYEIHPLAVEVRHPIQAEADLVCDALEGSGTRPPYQVPDAVVTVTMTPRDWARLFLPVVRKVDHQFTEIGDMSDPMLSSFCRLVNTTSMVAVGCETVSAWHGWEPKRTAFFAVSGVSPRLVWECRSTERHTYEELREAYPLFGLPKSGATC